MSAVLVSSDMMVSSRLSNTAQRANVPLTIALSAGDLTSQLSGQTRLVIVDLTQPGLNIVEAVSAVRTIAPAAKILAFGPHVDEELLAEASAAGCDLVLSNGQFHREQESLLMQFCP